MTAYRLARNPSNASALGRVTLAVMAAVACAGVAVAGDAMPPKGLVDALRGGGHVIYIRHASTETDYADQVDAVMGGCSTQRMLSEAGWREARTIGRAFERLGIPVGRVVSSEYCRAWQTADLAFDHYETNAALNFEPSEAYNDAQTAAMRERVVPLLASAPEPGKNLVIVGHDDPFEAATGIYPEPMGVAYVLKPDGNGGFDVLGAITPTDWQAIEG